MDPEPEMPVNSVTVATQKDSATRLEIKENNFLTVTEGEQKSPNCLKAQNVKQYSASRKRSLNSVLNGVTTYSNGQRPISITSANYASDLNPSIGKVESGNCSSSVELTGSSFREQKESRRHLWLDNGCLMAMGLALSNVWRLPTFVYFSYSGEALIVYVILMTVVGLPLFTMELALGQFGRSGIIKLWLAVPILKGVGVAQLLAATYQALYFPSLMTWAFQFGVIGMGGWSECDLISDSDSTVCLCEDTRNASCSILGEISSQEKCFNDYVLQNQLMNYKMLPMLAVIMILVTICVSFGKKFMKILLSASGILTVALLFTSLALALGHPNNQFSGNNDTAAVGIALLAPHEPWSFGRAEVWYGTMVQVLFSLSIGFGVLPSLSSSNAFSRDVIRQGMFLWFLNLLFGITSVITLFAWAGISGLYKNDVLKPNAFIYHIYYTASNSMTAGLAYAFIFFSGLSAMLPVFYALQHNIAEQAPNLKKRHWKLTCCALCVSLWAFNVLGIIPEGHEVVTMWDRYAAGGTVLTCLIIHVAGWQWFYGTVQLKLDFEFMLMRPVSKFWVVAWSYVAISILLTTQLWGFFGVPLDGTADCQYPVWLFASGWSFYLFALAIIILLSVRTVARQMDYGILNKLRCAIGPHGDWGPSDPQLYFEWRAIKDGTAAITPFFNFSLSKIWANNSSAPEKSDSTSAQTQEQVDMSFERF